MCSHSATTARRPNGRRAKRSGSSGSRPSWSLSVCMPSKRGDGMPSGRTFRQLVRDRLVKRGLYDTPRYWDMKAESYAGLARSIWPSNTYNRHWDARQMAILDAVLGDVTDLTVADV